MALKASERSKLRAALRHVSEQVLFASALTIESVCEDIYEAANERVPVLTGNLQNSLEMNAPSFTVERGEASVNGEVHFGEPGNVGGYDDVEAYTYMWKPGVKRGNWGGAILYDGWDEIKDRFVPELTENIKKQLL